MAEGTKRSGQLCISISFKEYPLQPVDRVDIVREASQE
jgi:hypothetical protein